MAQQRLLQQAFRFTASDFNDNYKEADYLREQFDGWTFEGSCYAIKLRYLQVGSSSNASSVATVKTPSLSWHGKVKVVVGIKNISNNAQAVSYTMGTSSNTIVSDVVPTDGLIHSVVFTIDEEASPTEICISNSGGSFYVTSVSACAVSDNYFFESFDGMIGKNNDQYAIMDVLLEASPQSTQCDHAGAEFNIVDNGNLRQATRSLCYYGNKGSYYKTPVLSSTIPERALLCLTVAKLSDSNNSYFTVSTDGTAQLSPVNSVNSDEWAASRDVSIKELTEMTATTYKFVVKDVAGTRLTFSGNYFFLDDIMLLPLPASVLDEGSDNSACIEAYGGMTGDVTLTRTLKAGIWNTMCLPFDVTTDMIGNGAELRTLTSSVGGDFVFNRVEEVEAGKPFLVKVSAEVKNPTFSGVTVENVQPQTVGDEGYQFCGTYSPIDLNTDGTHVFLGIDQAFHTPSAGGNSMNGLRAYFIVPKPDGTTTNARIAIYDEPSAIHDLSTSAAPKHSGCYDLTGRRHDAKQLSTGLYIRDGRKFYVK